MSKEKLSTDPLNLVVCGVGGQGNVLAARLIGRALIKYGYTVTIGETYGVSQRGGDVMSHVRLSQRTRFGPLIPLGGAHVALGLEPLETLRILEKYGNPEVVTITNTHPIIPVTVGMGDGTYPEIDELKRAIIRLSGQAWFLDASRIASDLGAGWAVNIVMVGALIGLSVIPVTNVAFEEVIKEYFRDDMTTLNIEAFRKGLACVNRKISNRR